MAEKNQNNLSRLARTLLWPLRLLVKICGWASLALALLAMTSMPWKIYGWLADDGARLKGDPEFIVMLGGGGIPSESGLMRSFACAEAARKFPKARVVVATPGDAAKPESTGAKIRDELAMRGVARQRVIFEDKGRHTREQAVNCFKLLGAASRQPSVLIVTSPEHVRRGLLSFRKAGFTNAAGTAAMDAPIETDLRFKTDELKNRPLPDVGQSLMVRYKFWNNVQIEGRILRELSALAYYKLLGWI